MTAVSTLPFGRPLTRADLALLPDDGHRYELIDGALIVSPAPRLLHQRAVGALLVALRSACPYDLEVIVAPFAVALADDTEVQPDLLVAARKDFTELDLPVPPLLAIEVLSPSTRRVDLLLKPDRYQAAGITSYWIVDFEEPSILVLELDGDEYVERHSATGASTISVEAPFALSLSPATLVR